MEIMKEVKTNCTLFKFETVIYKLSSIYLFVKIIKRLSCN